ncbi:MAG TPA: MBL fold metallo-hydrolase [Clostridia bacterium]|jgi:beta-lactamase superfamily II metal-dependent hydrolase|nr:MBL fold metallo-hydrolase [Clostridia bacterium]
MAKKKTTKKSKTQKSAIKMAEKVVKKLTPKQILLILAAVVIIVGVLVALYFIKPELFAFLKKPDVPPARENSAISDDLAFEAHFINVGQGDAILIRFADGTDVMIDAGVAGTTANPKADVEVMMLAYLEDVGLDAIDYMIVTHPDTDHYNMADAIFDAYDVKTIYANDINKNQTYTNFLQDAKDEVYSVHGHYDNYIAIGPMGDTYNITGDGFTIDIYAPGYDRLGNADDNYTAAESNGMSPIIVVTAAERKLLLTGDAIEATENWFMETIASSSYDCDFLKVGHHGSSTSSSETFLDFVTCEYAIVMADRDHDHGHPHDVVMDRYNARSIPTYVTEDHGHIVLKVDKEGNFVFEVQYDVPAFNNKNNVETYMVVAGQS